MVASTSNPEMLKYGQVDPWDSLAVQPSLLRELQAKETLPQKLKLGDTL